MLKKIKNKLLNILQVIKAHYICYVSGRCGNSYMHGDMGNYVCWTTIDVNTNVRHFQCRCCTCDNIVYDSKAKT